MKRGLLLLCLLFCGFVFAQTGGTVKGHITDLEANGEPLLFAAVQLQDSDIRTQTNFNGNFELPGITSGEYVIEVSFAGYETLAIPIVVVDREVTRVDKGMKAMTIRMADVSATVSAVPETYSSNLGPHRNE